MLLMNRTQSVITDANFWNMWGTEISLHIMCCDGGLATPH